MPIYKLNPELAMSAEKCRKNNHRRDDEYYQPFWELPESSKRGCHYEWKEDSDKHYADLFRRGKDLPAESGEERTESFIEREIREQRRRETELAVDHKYCTSHVDESGSPQHSAAHVEDRLQRQDSDDQCACQSDRNDDDRLFDEYKYTHSVESLIGRELVEQERREDELRQYWREMGFELNHNDNDYDNFEHRHNDDDNYDKVRLERHAERNETHLRRSSMPLDSKPTKHLASSFAEYAKQADDERSCLHAASHKDVSGIDNAVDVYIRHLAADPALAQSVKPSIYVREETQKLTKKMLLPLENDGHDDVEDEFIEMPLFEPQEERSLEREIRAARQREDELRHARGMTTTSHEESRRSAAVPVQVVRPLLSVTDVLNAGSAADRRQTDREQGYHTFTKRYAENRLKAELRRDRERELELCRNGTIRSISEERAGLQPKFSEILSHQIPPTTTHRSAPTAARERRLELPGSSKHIDVQNDEVAVTKAACSADTVSPIRRNIPPVLRKYASHYCDWQNSANSDTLTTSRCVPPEARVKEEMAEFIQRENELRKLREVTRYERMTSHDADMYPGNHQRAPVAASKSATSSDARRSPAKPHHKVPDRVVAKPEVTSHGGRRRLAFVTE